VSLPPTGGSVAPLALPAHHFVTRGVVLGMTGSGKTGLGDLPNLLLAFPSFDASHFTGWMEGHGAPDQPVPADLGAQLAAEREQQLRVWKIGADDLAQFHANGEVTVLSGGLLAAA
jgi:hypothetical protein